MASRRRIEEAADEMTAAAERVYQRWLADHPTATPMDQLAAIARMGNSMLRHGRRPR